MRIDVLRPDALTPAQVRRWTELRRDHAAVDSPFLRPEYVRAVAAVREDVEVAVLSDGDEPVGFFPYQRAGRVARPAGLTLSDFQGPTLHPDVDFDARDVLRACGLSAWRFDYLLDPAPAAGDGRWRQEPSPYLDLRGGFEAYADERKRAGSSLISKTRGQARRMGREVGPLRFEWHTADDRVFETLVAWKADQHHRTGVLEVLRLPWVLPLLGQIRVTTDGGWGGVLSALYAGDSLVAAHFGLRTESVLHMWFPTYDVDFARYSPGSILMVEMAEAAAAAGIGRIDLGHGPEPYKRSLMSGAWTVSAGAVDPRPVSGRLYRAWHDAKRRLRETPLRGLARIPKRLVRRLRYAPLPEAAG